jgi:hypothetical protein
MLDERDDLDGLDDDVDDLAYPLPTKQFSQEGQNVLLLSMMSWYWGFGLGGEVPLTCTWRF